MDDHSSSSRAAPLRFRHAGGQPDASGNERFACEVAAACRAILVPAYSLLRGQQLGERERRSIIMTPDDRAEADDDSELERLLVAAREALDRFHRLAGFPADVVAAAEALSGEAADAVEAYRNRKRRETDGHGTAN
jgi:hypothetical protein